MTPSAAKFWTYFFGTRPAWGMIPARIAFGIVLIIQALNYTESISFWVAMTFLAGVLSIPGIFARLAGAIILLQIALPFVWSGAPDVLMGDFSARILLFGIAMLLFTAGAGRHSIDHWLSIRLLRKFPNKKKELYCIAEMPLCKWWE